MIKIAQDLHDSYKSPDARMAVEYIWDIYTSEYSIERTIDIIKNIADNIEFLVEKKEGIRNERN